METGWLRAIRSHKWMETSRSHMNGWRRSHLFLLCNKNGPFYSLFPFHYTTLNPSSCTHDRLHSGNNSSSWTNIHQFRLVFINFFSFFFGQFIGWIMLLFVVKLCICRNFLHFMVDNLYVENLGGIFYFM